MKLIKIVKPNIRYGKINLAEGRSHFREHSSLFKAHFKKRAMGRLQKLPILNPTTDYVWWKARGERL